MILGEDLLPYSLLSTTSTICELKYGEKPKIGVHLKQTGSETRQPMFQELVIDGRETYKQQIEKFVSLKSGREKVPYTKIELFFPHPFFKVILLPGYLKDSTAAEHSVESDIFYTQLFIYSRCDFLCDCSA